MEIIILNLQPICSTLVFSKTKRFNTVIYISWFDQLDEIKHVKRLTYFCRFIHEAMYVIV